MLSAITRCRADRPSRALLSATLVTSLNTGTPPDADAVGKGGGRSVAGGERSVLPSSLVRGDGDLSLAGQPFSPDPPNGSEGGVDEHRTARRVVRAHPALHLEVLPGPDGGVGHVLHHP